MKYRGRLLLVRSQVKVTRRDRQSGILANDRQHDDLRIEGKIFHEALDNERLLRVFLSEEGEVRSDCVEQDRDDGCDAAKVTRSRMPLELLGKTFNVHVG